MEDHSKNQAANDTDGMKGEGGGIDFRGGYNIVYHEVESYCYSPDFPLDPTSKVFNCIKHKVLRDEQCRKPIKKSFIIKATGLEKRQVERALKALENKDIILVHRSKTGKVWNDNEYELHPKRFGELYNWYKNNVKFRVIDGGRLPSGSPVEVPSIPPVEVPSLASLQSASNHMESKENLVPNNPLNNQIHNNLRKTGQILTHEFGEEDLQKRRAELWRQAEMLGMLDG